MCVQGGCRTRLFAHILQTIVSVEPLQSGGRQQFNCPLERDVFPSPCHILASICTKFDSAADPEKRGILIGLVLVHRERETVVDFRSRQVFAAVGYDLGSKVPFSGPRELVVSPTEGVLRDTRIASFGLDDGL